MSRPPDPKRVVDLDARITAAQASVDRVQGFLEHASTTSELLSTEQALSQRQSDLEALRGQRTALADQVAMSTLLVSLTPPGHPAVEAPGPRTFTAGLGLGWHGLLAALRSLRRNGRMVLMGSMEVDLPITYREMLINNWELMGHFMYSGADYRALIALVRSGQVPLDAIEVERHAFEALEAAIDAAEKAEGLTCVTVCTS